MRCSCGAALVCAAALALAMVNGSQAGNSWTALGSGMEIKDGTSPDVHAVVFDSSGNLYAGGNFTTAGGVAANYIAKWNGSAWSALGARTQAE